jgi:hypothetical protein
MSKGGIASLCPFKYKCIHSTFDVGRSMFDVHWFLSSIKLAAQASGGADT